MRYVVNEENFRLPIDSMNSDELTEAEQSLLDSAQRRLGGNLAGFLLAGMDEPSRSRRRYVAQGGVSHGRVHTYQLEIVSEDGRGLPAGRDPLVLAAMLHFLLTSKMARDEIIFRDEELLTKLSWDDTTEVRSVIASAVERYFSTAYYLQRVEVLAPELKEARYSHVQKLITGYETSIVRLPGTCDVICRSRVIYFSSGLFAEISTAQKYFLGIDFESLGRLQPLPLEA